MMMIQGVFDAFKKKKKPSPIFYFVAIFNYFHGSHEMSGNCSLMHYGQTQDMLRIYGEHLW